jgi:hypothetical protein
MANVQPSIVNCQAPILTMDLIGFLKFIGFIPSRRN